MATRSVRPVVWFGGYRVQVACAACGSYCAAKQRVADGAWRLPAHKSYGRGKADQCSNPTLEPERVRSEYAAALLRGLRYRGSQSSYRWRGATLTTALSTEYNDTPGLSDGVVLFELFRDVIEFMLSDTLWRHVAAQEAGNVDTFLSLGADEERASILSLINERISAVQREDSSHHVDGADERVEELRYLYDAIARRRSLKGGE